MKILKILLTSLFIFSMCRSQDVAPTNAPGDFVRYTANGFSVPNFNGTFSIPGIVEMSYSLLSNKAIELKLNVGSIGTNKDTGYVELSTIEAGGFIIGQFSTEMKITGENFAATINIDGGYTLNITEMVMNQTLEILPGFQLSVKDCSVTADSVVLNIVNTKQNLPTEFSTSLFSWLSRALKEDLQDMICLAANAEAKKGIQSPIIRSVIFNANIAKETGSVLNFDPDSSSSAENE